MTRFEELLLELPDAPWDWNLVSSNPSVSFRFVKEHPAFPWNPKYISRNRGVSESDVRSNPEFRWDNEELCSNPNISLAYINEFVINPDVVKRINWRAISANASVHMSDIKSYPNHKWDHQYLSANPNITSNFILNEGCDIDWYRPFVSANPGITERDIYRSTLKDLFDWDYKSLSTNPNLPMLYVSKHPDAGWNYHEISCNAALIDIDQFQQISWDAHGLSLNRNMRFEYIDSHPELRWHLPSIVSNLGVNSRIEANWTDSKPIECYLSSNITIEIEWIKKNIKKLDWRRLSANPLQ